MGARIVLVARDQARGQVALARIRACSPRDAHRIHFADLSRLAEMKRVGIEIASAESRLDVLINNAGALFGAGAGGQYCLRRPHGGNARLR